MAETKHKGKPSKAHIKTTENTHIKLAFALLTAQKLDPVATEQMFIISCEMQQVQVQGEDNQKIGNEMYGQLKWLIGTKLCTTKHRRQSSKVSLWQSSSLKT